MPEMPITFLKGDKMGSETDYRDALPVNMFGVLRPNFGADGYMLQMQGLTEYAQASGIDRGGVWNDRFKKHFRVSGNDFVEISDSGAVSVLGAVPGTDIVSLPYSFDTQAIIADGNYYLYDAVNGFRQVPLSAPIIDNPIDAVWVDGYYFFTNGNTIYHTDATDEETVDTGSQSVAEFMPDDSLGVAKTQDNKVMVFGRYSVEYFVNVGSTGFAFQRIPTRGIKIGIVATHCKTELKGKWYILGGRKEEALSIHIVTVGDSTKIASREVDKIIGKYTEPELSQASVEAFEEDGYSFVLVHLPNEVLLFNETLAKSVGAANAWTILKSDIDGDTPWRARFGIFEANKGAWYFGDKQNATIGLLDNTVATQYDNIVEWILFTPYMNIERGSIDELEIETIPGFTGSTDATVAMSLTYNGVTYGKEWFELYGLPSDYEKRFIIRRLGYVRDWLGIKLRGATSSRMAFGRGLIRYG